MTYRAVHQHHARVGEMDPARLLRPVGLLPITLFGVFVLVTTLPYSLPGFHVSQRRLGSQGICP